MFPQLILDCLSIQKWHFTTFSGNLLCFPSLIMKILCDYIYKSNVLPLNEPCSVLFCAWWHEEGIYAILFINRKYQCSMSTTSWFSTLSYISPTLLSVRVCLNIDLSLFMHRSFCFWKAMLYNSINGLSF